MHQDYTEALQNVFLFPDDSQGKGRPSPQSSSTNSTTSIHSVSSIQSRNELSPVTSRQGLESQHDSITDTDQFTRSAARAVITASPSDSVEGEVENLLVASQFCVIESPFVRKSSYEGDCSILSLDNEDLQLVENHFEEPMPGKRDMLKAARYLPTPVCKYNIQEFNVSWKLYAGHDFPSASGMQYGRDKTNLVDLCFQKIELLYEQYSHPKYKSRLAIACDDVEVLDRISASSINKMLYCYSAENCLRQAHAHMILFKSLECAPSETTQEGSEFIVRLNLLPVRLNFDQRTVFFLSDFFSDNNKSNIEIFNNNNETKKGGKVKFALAAGDSGNKDRVSFKNSDPDQLRVELPPTSGAVGQPKKEFLPSVDGISDNPSAALPTSCKSAKGSPMKSRSASRSGAPSGRSTSFIKEFCFLSDVLIKFDYQGQYLDMDRGRLVGLLVGLAQVQCSQLVLKKIHANQGILGFDNLVLYCVTEWLRDIKKNQIPTLLGGIGPIYSFTQIMHGLIDLVCMPIEQYRRDGRLLKGFQRGAASFTTSSTAAALQLTNRLISAIHFTAETAFDLLSPNPRKAILPPPHSRHAAQPNDFREGLNMAYKTLYEGLSDTAITLVQEAVDGKDTRGLTGAVGGVLRQIPPTLIAPVILASEATSTVIDGVSHQLVPDCRHEALNKWKY